MACDKKWLPLESNPDVMNKFLSNVGVPDDFTMIDVVDLDDEHLENLPKKVKAVLFLFPTGEQHEEFCQSEQETIDAEGQVVSDRVYFMKLEANNASGTVSLIHAIANADEELELGPTSTLKEFLDRTADMSSEERGQELEMDENLCCVHEELAKEGQTEAPEADEEIKLHFITFVTVDEQLYELDARKNYPINHGSTSVDTLMKDSVSVCKKFMERDPENVNFSIMALVAGASAETEEEEVEE
ncbi:ubiquitin carboxyl-terminal hydrolase isozyme L3 [Caerostris extrusa]|uniref:Ubiquitin carboxyl-terminal hydrolase n=1 Tax=Caerostris extrusa TaxID=172846 RepID=A0AAV4NCE3_CAEEX|nr:ubiquitin carboxyl-terminal hydrolase isozyme L3 [Caerostris extrusa]